MDLGKRDTSRLLTVKVQGYLQEEIQVDYDSLNQRYPEIYVGLIPEIPTYGYSNLVELKGQLRGISQLMAVSMNNYLAKLEAYNERKQQIKLFSAGRLLENSYAILHRDAEELEEISVATTKNPLILRLKEPLKTPVKPLEEIVRIVRGRTDGSGNYLLRLRQDGKGTDYLISYMVDGEKKFKRIVFDNPQGQEASEWEL